MPCWAHVCSLEDIYPESGVCASIDGHQVAVFRVRGGIYALANRDPASGANVLSRGIVGDLGEELVVASPMYKHHFSLISGECLEEPELRVAVYPARLNEGQVWVRSEPAFIGRRSRGKRRLVVIGDGPAALRTVEELLSLAPHAFDITVFGGEPHDSDPSQPAEETAARGSDWFEGHGIAWHAADRIEHIDRVHRCVRSAGGAEQSYDRLLLATGALPAELPLPGANLLGVVTYRDVSLSAPDTTLAGRRAVVLGGGHLGLEAANALMRQGMAVTVVHGGAVLMDQQLDAQAAELVRQELTRRGLSFCLAAQPAAILGSIQTEGVRLADGRELAAEIVVIATGSRPNVELARAAGVACGRGILVDDTLQTFDPSIYAVGDCIEHRGGSYGASAPLAEQARVCAAYLAERGVRRYRGTPRVARLRIGGVEVFAAGDVRSGVARESVVLRDPKRGIYKRLVLENDRVRGVVLYGDTRDGTRYLDLIREERAVGASREQLMFASE